MTRTGRQIDLNQGKSSSAQSEEINSYILHISLITNLVPDCYGISLLIFQSLSLITSFSFYTIFPFHLYPPCASRMVGVDTCLISTFLKSLGVAVRLKNTVQRSLPHQSQLQSIQCGGSSFLLDISELPSFLYVHNSCPYQWNFLEDHYERQDIYLVRGSFIRGDTTPQTTSLNLFICNILMRL